ncbi:MAG: helix-turn-helix domain-containing protein [Afipia sp.]
MSERKSRARSSEGPHPVDVIAGRNLHIARTLAGYSQQRLAEAVGISFQQVQKYENAKNRMSISRAWEFSSILGISLAAILEGADDNHSDIQLKGPKFKEWLALYARAREIGQLHEITALAGRVVTLCELTARDSSQCR